MTASNRTPALPLVAVQGLKKRFQLPGGWLTGQRQYVHAVDGVDLQINQGDALGVVGESGCGKTTLGRLILHLIEPTEGEIYFRGEPTTHLRRSEMLPIRRHMQAVFQNPQQSLNPRMKVLGIVAEPLRAQKAVGPEGVQAKVIELLEQVGLGAQHLDRYPHELSGGQCQRVAIARAMALEPELLVLDEPTSALDVSVQAQILNLLNDLKAELGLTYLFISHDLGVVEYLCDHIAVMYLGLVVESGPSEAVFAEPLHPYTQALLGAVPEPTVAGQQELTVLEGNVPSPIDPPAGCRFHTRCPLVMERCKHEIPLLRDAVGGRQVACHLVDVMNFGSEEE